MEPKQLLLYLSIFLASLSILFASLAIFAPGTLDNLGLTGYATAGINSTGKINLTMMQGVIINFTTDYIDWGAGIVDAGRYNATLDTSRTQSGCLYSTSVPNCLMYGANFSGPYGANNKTSGLIVYNIGNVNASVFLHTDQNATTLLGGSTPSAPPLYQFNVTNNGTNACTPPAGFTLGAWYDMNKTVDDGTPICGNLSFVSNKNSIKIDVRIVIPSTSRTGYLYDNITVVAEQAY